MVESRAISQSTRVVPRNRRGDAPTIVGSPMTVASESGTPRSLVTIPVWDGNRPVSSVEWPGAV